MTAAQYGHGGTEEKWLPAALSSEGQTQPHSLVTERAMGSVFEADMIISKRTSTSRAPTRAVDNATDYRRSSLIDPSYAAEKHCKILLFPKPQEGNRTKPFQQPRVIEAALSLDSFCE